MAREIKRRISDHGYVVLYMPDHPLAMSNGRVYEHRLVLEEKLGRPLMPDEHAHHIDGDKTNNDPSNLEAKCKRRHLSDHHKKRNDLQEIGAPNEVIHCRCGCGAELLRFDPDGRPRSHLHGHNKGNRNSPFMQIAVLELIASGITKRRDLVRSEKAGNHVDSVLYMLKKEGKIINVSKGEYKLA